MPYKQKKQVSAVYYHHDFLTVLCLQGGINVCETEVKQMQRLFDVGALPNFILFPCTLCIFEYMVGLFVECLPLKPIAQIEGLTLPFHGCAGI